MSETQPLLSDGERKLRIAIVAENFLPKVDGVTRTICRLLEYIRDNGHEAIVFVPRSPVSSYAGQRVYSSALSLPLPAYPELRLGFLRPDFFWHLREFKPDVIHIVDPNFLGAQTILALDLLSPWWTSSVAHVTSYHTNTPIYNRMFEVRAWADRAENATWGWLRFLHNKCQITFCPTPSVSSALSKHGFRTVRLWPGGADVALFTPSRRSRALREEWGAGEDTVVVLYTGRLSREKNIFFLVTALSLLPPDVKRRCKTVFVGHGPERGALEAFCTVHGVDAVFAGYQTGEALATHFASADVFAFASYTETFGLVVLEALAAGLPVVGLDAGGTRDIMQTDVQGQLLPLPKRLNAHDDDARGGGGASEWSGWPEFFHACEPGSDEYEAAVHEYARMLGEVVQDGKGRSRMAREAVERARKVGGWDEVMDMLVGAYGEAEKEAKRAKEKGKDPRRIEDYSVVTKLGICALAAAYFTLVGTLAGLWTLAHPSVWLWSSSTSVDEAVSAATSARADVRGGGEANWPTILDTSTCTRRGICPIGSPPTHGIYYELHGPPDGERMLFIMGMNESCFAWQPQVAHFAGEKRCAVLVFDARGVGNSGAPRGAWVWTTREMAGDVRALLECVGWIGEGRGRGVHVVGMSLGGMIAQELAVMIPEEIPSLVLAATSSGGHVWDNVPTWHTFSSIVKATIATSDYARVQVLLSMMYPRAWLEGQASAEYVADVGLPLLGKEAGPTNRDVQAEVHLARMRVTRPQKPSAALKQMAAALTHRAVPERLGALGKVVVVVGSEDRVMRVVDSVRLYERLRGDEHEHEHDDQVARGKRVELVVLWGVGHGVSSQDVRAFNAVIGRAIVEGERMGMVNSDGGGLRLRVGWE